MMGKNLLPSAWGLNDCLFIPFGIFFFLLKKGRSGDWDLNYVL